jgi:hypothetical protein
MNEIEKVSILLIALGPKRAKRILDRLGPDELLPIVETMRRMKKISPEARESVLEEVNGILEDLAASSFPGTEFDPGTPPIADPPETSPSAHDILKKVRDELPDRIEPNTLPEIDWGAAGFDFGSGNGGKRKDDHEPPSDPGLRR